MISLRFQGLAGKVQPLAWALAGLVTMLYWCNFDGLAKGYWDTYIIAPAMVLNGDPVDFRLVNGEPAFPPLPLARSVPQVLINEKTFGIICQDQRLGSGITYSLPYAAFGLAGFRGLYALIHGLIFLMAFELGVRLWGSGGAALLLGLLTAANPLLVGMNRLNPAQLAIAALLGMLVVAWTPPVPWWLVGLIYGAAGGIRNEIIVLGPALVVLIWLRAEKPWKALALFTTGAFLTITPLVVWNKFAFGEYLIHSSQFGGYHGWRPFFAHSFFKWQFQFNGLLNWPFHTDLIRTPHYPFPTFLTLPLEVIRAFGVFLSALGVLGFFTLLKRNLRWWDVLFLWLAVYYLLFAFQENWEPLKSTFVTLLVPPMTILMVEGAKWFAEGLRHWQRWASLALAAGGLWGAVVLCRWVEVPADQRWYQRFPHAAKSESGLPRLTWEYRDEWQYFSTAETPEEIAEVKGMQTAGNFLPRFDKGGPWPLKRSVLEAKGEFLARTLRTLDVWDYIYSWGSPTAATPPPGDSNLH